MLRFIYTGWWLNQPLWKICSSKWESPNRGQIKKKWNYHLDHLVIIFHVAVHLYLSCLIWIQYVGYTPGQLAAGNLPRNLQQDLRFTDPEQTWVSNNSIATYWTGSVGIGSHSIFDGNLKSSRIDKENHLPSTVIFKFLQGPYLTGGWAWLRNQIQDTVYISTWKWLFQWDDEPNLYIKNMLFNQTSKTKLGCWSSRRLYKERERDRYLENQGLKKHMAGMKVP